MKSKDIEVRIRLEEGDPYSTLRPTALIELSGVVVVSTAVVTSTGLLHPSASRAPPYLDLFTGSST